MHKEAGHPLRTCHFRGNEAKNICLGTGYTNRVKPELGKAIIDQSE